MPFSDIFPMADLVSGRAGFNCSLLTLRRQDLLRHRERLVQILDSQISGKGNGSTDTGFGDADLQHHVTTFVVTRRVTEIKVIPTSKRPSVCSKVESLC